MRFSDAKSVRRMSASQISEGPVQVVATLLSSFLIERRQTSVVGL